MDLWVASGGCFNFLAVFCFFCLNKELFLIKKKRKKIMDLWRRLLKE